MGFKNYRYELCKKYLSLDAQLTNIMRHVSNGLPISLVLKDKNLLFRTLKELAKIKTSLKNEILVSNEIDWHEIETIDNQKEEEK